MNAAGFRSCLETTIDVDSTDHVCVLQPGHALSMCVCVRIHLQVRIPMWVNQETHEHTIHAFEHTDHVCVLQPGHALSICVCVCTYTPAGTYSYVGKPGNTRTHHRRIRTYGSRMCSAAWTRVIHMCVCVCTYTPAGTYSYVGKPGNTRTHHRRTRTLYMYTEQFVSL